MDRTALITGITGQDGSYLAELLLEKGYAVHGYSRQSVGKMGSAAHLVERLTMHRFSIHDSNAWNQLLADLRPTELYNFAADSFIPNSWKEPVATHEVNVGLPLRILDALRKHSPETRFLNACSREVFGNCADTLVSERTAMNPTTCYGISKAAARWTVAAYREQYGLFATNAILFNHESPRRSLEFVTRKITCAAAQIATGLGDSLELGNTNVARDWGYAVDFVDGMWRMLQVDSPEDFVLGTGRLHSLKEFVENAFAAAGLTWQRHLRSSDQHMRSIEPTPVAADIEKAKRILDWEPATGFSDLVAMMVEHDLAACRRQVGRLAAA